MSRAYDVGGASPIPGLAPILVIAVGARLVARFTGAVPDVVLALVAGMLLRNFLRCPPASDPALRCQCTASQRPLVPL